MTMSLCARSEVRILAFGYQQLVFENCQHRIKQKLINPDVQICMHMHRHVHKQLHKHTIDMYINSYTNTSWRHTPWRPPIVCLQARCKMHLGPPSPLLAAACPPVSSTHEQQGHENGYQTALALSLLAQHHTSSAGARQFQTSARVCCFLLQNFVILINALTY